MIDIDNFKDINDLRGHVVGDLIIRRVAAAVAGQIGPDALLGRLGGDEFAVIVPGGTAPRRRWRWPSGSARRCRSATAVDPTLHVTVSIGVAPIAAGQASDAALAHADLALYAAKAAGRNRARLFCEAHYQAAAHRVSLLQRVGAALEEGHDAALRPADRRPPHGHARPATSCSSGSATGWSPRCPRPTSCPRPSAPTSCSSSTAGCWSARCGRWPTRGPQAAGLRLEVNVSARSLENPDLGRWILELLKEAEVAPERLGLEITETTAIKSLDAARLLATRLTEAGCGFALDDFGAGLRLVLLPQVPPVHHGQDRRGVRAPGRRPRRRPRAGVGGRRAWPTSSACARWPSRWTGPRW